MFRTTSVVVFCWVAAAALSQACRCVQEAFCKKAQRADYLFRGVVQEVQTSPGRDAVVYIVRAQQVFKSAPGIKTPPPSTIFAVRSTTSPSACGLKLAVEDDYLFATDLELWITSCSATKPWESIGDDDLAALKAGGQCPDCAALKCGIHQRCTTIGSSAVCEDICLPGRCSKSEICSLVPVSNCDTGPCPNVAVCTPAPPTPPQRCLRNCTSEFSPVCGSNGVTYANKCLLKNAACQDPDVRLATAGACCARSCCRFRQCRPFSKGEYCTDMCHPERCPKGYRCKLQKSRSCTPDFCPEAAVCEPACGQTCSDRYAPICASNGVTFGNRCELQRAQCEDSSLAALHPGICSWRDAICGRPTACPEIYEPVCGSDGVTYPNACYLEQARCGDANLVITNEGTCETSCDLRCPSTGRPVCSNQGITYANECLLKQAACKHRNVWLAKDGACDKCP